MDWDVLEGEDSLTGTQLSTQGPFPFHTGGSESVSPVETSQIIGLSWDRWEPVDLSPHSGCPWRIGGWEETDPLLPPRC